MTENLTQGTPEWHSARLGSLGASKIDDATATTKSGSAASVAAVETQLILESITGRQTETFQSAAMKLGTEREPDARIGYEFITGATVEQVGLFRHPRITRTHASPDGLIVGTKGGIEIKCPSAHTHLEYLMSEKIPGKYQKQMIWQAACCGLEFVDFVSFNPEFPEDAKFFIQRFNVTPEMVAELEAKVEKFITNMLAKEEALRAKLERKAA